MRFLSILVVVAMLDACGFAVHCKTNIASDPHGVTRSCVTRCDALHEDPGDYAACFKECRGVTVADGACNRDDLEFGEVCADARKSTTVGTALVVLGVVLVGVVGFGVYRFEKELDADWGDGWGEDDYGHSYDPH